FSPPARDFNHVAKNPRSKSRAGEPSANCPPARTNIKSTFMPQTYESPQMLAEYLLFHYGDDADVMPWEFGPKNALQYPARCAEICRQAANGHASRVLDLGCAVGKSTFEL